MDKPLCFNFLYIQLWGAGNLTTSSFCLLSFVPISMYPIKCLQQSSNSNNANKNFMGIMEVKILTLMCTAGTKTGKTHVRHPIKY